MEFFLTFILIFSFISAIISIFYSLYLIIISLFLIIISIICLFFVFNINIFKYISIYGISIILIPFFLFPFLVNNKKKLLIKFLNFSSINDYKIENIKARVLDIQSFSNLKFNYSIKIQLIDYNFIFLINTINDTKLEVDDIILIRSLKLNKNINDRYFFKSSILNILYVPFLRYKILNRQRFTLNKTLYNLKSDLDRSLQLKLDSLSYLLFNSIFLGKPIFDDKFYIKDRFKLIGILHYLARSGLHLAIINSILLSILFVFSLNSYLLSILSIIIVYLYRLLTYDSISFLRSFFMIIIYNLSKLFSLNLTSLSILYISALIMLINNPFIIIYADFQLSFFFTLIILIFNKINNIKRLILLKHDLYIT
jgi:hypothetical protein